MYVMLHSFSAYSAIKRVLAVWAPTLPIATLRSSMTSVGQGASGIPPRRGLWFEDYAVGQEYDSPARTITESDILSFAALSGDFNPLHIEEEFARRSTFRRRIAHGLLVESIASGLAHGTGIFDGTISALTEIEIRFLRPVFIGDNIRLRLLVVEVDPEPSKKRGRVRFSTAVSNQTDENVLEGTWSVVFLRKNTHASTPRSREDAP